MSDFGTGSKYITGKWNSLSTAHFPRQIPTNAQAVRLFFNPGALQGATIFELGYSTTPEKINMLIREYSRRSSIFFKASMKNEYIEPANYVAEDTQDYGRFSEDYTLFFLDEKPPISEKDWNHPHSHGIAISRKRCRVVYWAWSG